ncbi:MAG: helix-turn-helix domain-containing protein [Alphaproteobacteria bacterium]|nr:helix-turn-helix domain-containing protein [Alphaproteobacteria bacterium]
MTEESMERRRGRTVGEDLRRRAVAAVLEGRMSARAAARHFEVSHTAVSRWIARYRRRGHLRPDRSPGRPSRTEAERERIFRLLDGRPDLSIRALQQALAAEGAAFSASALHRFLTRHGLRRRRRLSWRRNPAPQAAGGR